MWKILSAFVIFPTWQFSTEPKKRNNARHQKWNLKFNEKYEHCYCLVAACWFYVGKPIYKIILCFFSIAGMGCWRATQFSATVLSHRGLFAGWRWSSACNIKKKMNITPRSLLSPVASSKMMYIKIQEIRCYCSSNQTKLFVSSSWRGIGIYSRRTGNFVLKVRI